MHLAAKAFFRELSAAAPLTEPTASSARLSATRLAAEQQPANKYGGGGGGGGL
jgi:hypothetical protein